MGMSHYNFDHKPRLPHLVLPQCVHLPVSSSHQWEVVWGSPLVEGLLSVVERSLSNLVYTYAKSMSIICMAPAPRPES